MRPLTVIALLILAMVISLLLWWKLGGPAVALTMAGVELMLDAWVFSE